MNFSFLEETPILNFICALVIVDARVRKMWTLCTQNKRPPLDIVRYFRTIELDGKIGDQHKNGHGR